MSFTVRSNLYYLGIMSGPGGHLGGNVWVFINLTLLAGYGEHYNRNMKGRKRFPSKDFWENEYLS